MTLPAAFVEEFNQVATYWPPAGNDGFGGVRYGAPEPRRVRWQHDAQLFRDAQGREVVSNAVVYLDAPVVNGGMLYLGSSLELAPPAAALEVRQVAASPDLGATEQLNKAWL